MIYTCTVPGCGQSFEQGEDHLPEPCPACWKLGWRTDSAGNTYQVKPIEGWDQAVVTAHCTPELAEFLDPTGTLRREGLLVVSKPPLTDGT